jgi:PncC family amidohydrolase
LIAERLTSVAGSSAAFKGGVVSYNSSVKREVLGVTEDDLRSFTAVSEQVARAMVRGALALLKTDIAVAVTGYAGPDGGGNGDPVGLVFIACATREAELVHKAHFEGTRQQIREQACVKALEMIMEIST